MKRSLRQLMSMTAMFSARDDRLSKTKRSLKATFSSKMKLAQILAQKMAENGAQTGRHQLLKQLFLLRPAWLSYSVCDLLKRKPEFSQDCQLQTLADVKLAATVPTPMLAQWFNPRSQLEFRGMRHWKKDLEKVGSEELPSCFDTGIAIDFQDVFDGTVAAVQKSAVEQKS